MSAACEVAGVSRAFAYAQREKFPRLREQWDAALDAGLDALEASILERALDTSDKLAMYILSSRRPEKWGKQRQEVEIRAGNVRDSMTPKERKELEAMSLEELEAEINKHL